MAITKQGLVVFKLINWEDQEETREHILKVHDIPWDFVRFSHSANPYWSQRGTYEDRKDFVGFGVHWVTGDPNEPPSPKKDYYVHVEEVGFFRDLDHYYRFLKEHMSAEITEELWTQ